MATENQFYTEEKFRLLCELFIVDKEEKQEEGKRVLKTVRSNRRSKIGSTDSKNPIRVEGKRDLKLFYKEALEMYESHFPKKAGSLSFTDLIETAIDKLASGKRKWDVQKYPNALGQLRLAYMSELKNLYTKERVNRMISSIEENEIRDIPSIDILPSVSFPSDEIEKRMDARNKVKEISKFISERMTENDKKVFEGMAAGLTDKEISKESGLSKKRVEKIKSKIRTRLRNKYTNY
jgi:RNA polymerase sigma factor (sigma-70 family)